MTGTIADIWRHPIKSHGVEALKQAGLEVGKTLPGDRLWAVQHEAAKLDGPGWASCANFLRVAKAPALAALRARLHTDGQTVTLTHPERPDLTFKPDQDAAMFLDWIAPLCPANRAQPVGLVRNDDRGYTDSPEPTVSLCNYASHRAVAQKLGHDISPLRWRGNIWLDGLGPWEEFEWIGRTLRIGTAELEVIDRIERCTATMANPETGLRDADTLAALREGWGHQDFAVYGVVKTPGEIAIGAPCEVIT
ncbi:MULTISPECIES: MOSC domain-containing protein [unclassified Dinoroseobacter]|uniref:MOSC domain-containing protein n=1 Tax=unclassified Dinoroseobacter TaxID=2620028 RepID=UPI003C79F479